MHRQIRTVLLVDGSAALLFDLGLLLRRLEYRVDTARNAEDALRSMEDSPPSIVMTEIVLSGMSGVQLIERMREHDRLKAVPVVVLTADRDDRSREACVRLGCKALLSKPIEPDVLYRTLQSVSESIPRANIRLKTSLKIIVGDGTAMGGAERTEQAAALSEGGLYVATRYPQPRNAVTPVRLFLPGGEIKAKALVLYSYTTAAGPYQEPGMGMKFVEIAEADLAAIKAYIREQLTGDILLFPK
jgi:CheY-like chemotaxis protein